MIDNCVVCGVEIYVSGHLCDECRQKLMKQICDERCKTCKYVMRIGAGQHDRMCGYCVQTDHLRGCPTGEECTKYERGFE